MATWGIGDNHDSDEVQVLKEQLRTKDAQIVTLHSQLAKKGEEKKDFTTTYNDVADKLRRETDRALQLEEQLQKHSEDLQNERITRQNIEVALAATQQKLKGSEHSTQELHSILDTLSLRVESSSADKAKLESENSALQRRVRDLQAELAVKESSEQVLRHSQSAGNPSSSRGRRRSSSVSAFRVSALERQVADSQAQSVKQASGLQDLRDRLSRAQDALVRLENEKMASEKRFKRELEDMQSQLQEREEDMRSLQGRGGDDAAAREHSLLERLEDEEQRVAALQSELAHSAGSHKRELAVLQGELARTQSLLEDANAKADDWDSRMVELVSQKEDALNVRDQLQATAQDLELKLQIAYDRISQLEIAPTPSSPDSETAATVQRLLGMIERLRGERDQLQSHLEFLTVENRFAVEDLNAKLAAANEAAASAETQETPMEIIPSDALEQRALWQHRLKHASRAALVFSLVAQHVEAEHSAQSTYAQSLLQDLIATRHGLQQAQRDVQEKEGRVSHLLNSLQDNSTQIHHMKALIDEAEQNLRAAESRVSDLTQALEHLRDQYAKERGAHEQTGQALSQTETQLADVAQALADTEEQRDALALQIRHTEQDLDTVRKELAEADSRYGKQLQAMSTGDATRALRDQIRALEDRVQRRTEQIGVHQHDIKRLETNLRLQEDLVTELTEDLEVLRTEKEALVEDCKTNRDARDEALRKCESLEETMECLDEEKGKLSLAVSSATESEQSLNNDILTLSSRLANQEAQCASLLSSLEESQAQRAGSIQKISELRAAHATALETLDQRTTRLQSLLEQNRSISDESIQATIAFAVVSLELRSKTFAYQQVKEAQRLVYSETASLQAELERGHINHDALHQELKDLQARHTEDRTKDAAHITEMQANLDSLETELHRIRAAHAEISSLREHESSQLVRAQEELRQYLEDSADHSSSEAQLSQELLRLRAQHGDEVAALQMRLEQASVDLKSAHRSLEDTSASHQHAQNALMVDKEGLERRLAESAEKLEAITRSNEELNQQQSSHDSELQELHAECDRSTKELQMLTIAHEELVLKCGQITEELEVLTSQVAEKTQRHEQVEAELERLHADHADEVKALQGRLDALESQLRDAQSSSSELDGRYIDLQQQASNEKQDLEHQLSSLREEVDYLKASLQGEMDLYTRDQKKHEHDLEAANERRLKAEEAQKLLGKELEVLRTRLEDARSNLETLQEEKTTLQFETTSLEAEVQRSKSLHGYLEKQVKESESQISALRQELESTRENAVRFEKDCKAAEVELSMREIQHEQAVAALRRDLNALRANPKLEDKVIELEERHQEMEELLRSKCQEIEENDDRVLEMLKEKKKLTSKIESLSRKVHTLQAKLAAASETPAPPPQEPRADSSSRPASRASSINLASSRSTKSAAPLAPRMPVPMPTTPKTQTRAVSGPSVPSRPKTPESKTPQLSVFRTRTPEPKRAPPSVPQAEPPLASSSSSSVGQKRRAPDDFDDCDSVPPQGFTVDSVPSAGPVTPRARRALQPVKTGFTPVRSHPIHASSVQLSPSRRATTGAPLSSAPLPPAIADVTNSPRSKSEATKTAKRGWLGKIRNGTTAAVTSRSVSSRPTSSQR